VCPENADGDNNKHEPRAVGGPDAESEDTDTVNHCIHCEEPIVRFNTDEDWRTFTEDGY
jgi:hypothetical protein